MASQLPLTIKKEDDVMPRASLFPKRKTAIANIPPRARFAKARPNIGGLVSKTTKDAQPTVEAEKKSSVTEEPKSSETKEKSQVSNTESTTANDNLQSSESETIVLETPIIKKEDEILQRPSALPKRTLATPAAPRARYQKARPNIAALASKKPKTVSTPIDSVETLSKEKDAEDSSNSKLPESQDDIEKESTAQSTSVVNPITAPEPVVGFSFTKGIMEVFPEKSSNVEPDNPAENHLLEILNTSVNESLSAANEEEVVQNSEECVVLNSVEEQECPETVAKDPQTPEKKKSNYLKLLSKTTKSNSEAGKEGAASTSIFSKANEYPTLKSILNSPRKRITTKKTYERKRRLANLAETPSRSEMTMTDLIYYNPAGEPMKIAKPQTRAVENLPADENTKPTEEEPPPEEDESSNPPVPKVIISENGEIIIDESSLVVRRKETIDTSIEAIIENDNTTYSSFRKKSAKQWSNKETSKFYKALSLVGTDFALMENIFTVNGNVTRSRRELKLKFKREEKLRLNLVHKAMYETQTYDISILEDDPDDFSAENVDEPPEPSAPKKRGRKPKAVVGNENKPKATTKKNKAKYSTSESTNENPDPIYEIPDEEMNDVLQLNGQVNSNGHDSNLDDDQASKSPKISRPQRARKNKTLTDYITDIEESEHSDDYLSDCSSEAITKKKPPDTSETAEVIDNNGQSTSIVKPKRGRKRKSSVLPPDYFENIEAQVTGTNMLTKESFILGPPETEFTVSRLGRVRKTRILTDYITDEEEIDEGDDESVKGVGSRNARILSDNSNGDSCIMVEQIDSLPDNSTVEVIAKVKEESEDSPEVLVIPQNITDNDRDINFVPPLVENISCDLEDNHRTAVSNTNTNSTLPQSLAQNVTVCNQVPSENDINSSSSVNIQHINTGQKRKAFDGEIQCIEFEQPSSEHVVHLLDAASEVVITDTTKAKRMRRRAAMPNLAMAKRRPGVETEVPQVKPSFSNFTPKENSSNPSKPIITRPFEPLWTYSRNIKRDGETVLALQADDEVIIKPNLAQVKRRPGVETEVPQVKPSFSNFTPKENSSNPSKPIITRPFEPLWTYSRNIKRKGETVLPLQADDEVIIVNSDQSAQEKDNLKTSFQNNSVPGTSFNNNSISGSSLQNNVPAQTLPKNNSFAGISLPVPGTSFETNQTILNLESSTDSQQQVLEPTSFPENNQTILSSTLSFPNSQAITLDSDGTSTDPPPVMIFTKSPNNENILHLFMVQSPKPCY
ncbi:hypothetical protein JTE90_011883 [Oedothorax gibbosus]|uniref:Transcription factor TFIIIB component B'' Myb domain-containing protein n=1 Tax=Oedothorax gibbosus TaxID=931172 RepID=A0AAV6V3A6_9ARAC|nr:hypothetical protein JTE90_011883 [Oedothorax gibbosus]